MSVRLSDLRRAFFLRTLGTSVLMSVFALASTSGFAVAAPGVPKTNSTKKTKRQFPPRVLTAMSTPLKSGHPILFLNAEAAGVENSIDPLYSRLWFPADQRYSKWSVLFDEPLHVDTVEVATCADTKPFSDGVELFVDYNEKRVYADGGRAVVKFKVGAKARAITLNFLESPGLCLERVVLKTSAEWLRPRALLVGGSSVLADGSWGVPARALFGGKKTKFTDSRAPGKWRLQWENPLIVESLRVWNGNQNPGDVFLEDDRVKELEILSDEGKKETARLENRRDFQTVELKTPQAIRRLDFKSLSTFEGTSSVEPTMAEVQLSAGGENWIPVSPMLATAEKDSRVSSHVVAVRENGYGDILDRELRVSDRGDVWRFRFRSDGTFFARVFVDKARVARAWSVAGQWRLTEITRPKIDSKKSKSLFGAFAKSQNAAVAESEFESPGLVFAISGMKMSTSGVVDSLPCGNQCFGRADDRRPAAPSARELPVQDRLEIKRERRAIFYLRNRTEAEKRTLEFGDLKVRIHSLYD